MRGFCTLVTGASAISPLRPLSTTGSLCHRLAVHVNLRDTCRAGPRAGSCSAYLPQGRHKTDASCVAEHSRATLSVLWTPRYLYLALTFSLSFPPPATAQVLILNGSRDRETAGMDARDVVNAICRVCLNDIDDRQQRETKRPADVITDVFYLEEGELHFPKAW